MNTRLDYILGYLLSEKPEYKSVAIPTDTDGKRRLMRSLLNVRTPLPVSDDFITAQDIELSNQRDEKGIVDINSIPGSPINNRLKLWQGDITRLQADAIVNAANNQMLGCFVPLHGCIDNAIHSAAGVQLRLECYSIMQEQGHSEPTGSARLTKAYSLPAKYVIHTVGPIIGDRELTQKDETELADCYHSCLALADTHSLQSIALCCISTGEFRFPNQRAAEIAVEAVTRYLHQHPDTRINSVLFNVFKDTDYTIYHNLLQTGEHHAR